MSLAAQRTLIEKIANIRQPLVIAADKNTGEVQLCPYDENQFQALLNDNLVIKSIIPAFHPEFLGNQAFCQRHGCRYAYIVGEMANGIASSDLVIAAAKSGFLGSFGAAGLLPDVVEKNIVTIKNALASSQINWGANLIYSPNEPAIESKTVEVFLKHDVRRVSASAYMDLSKHIVRYMASGLQQNADGSVARKNSVIAKISRPEVAEKFMLPPPAAILEALVNEGKITAQEAQLAATLPIAEDITAESDSGGHTDNRPLLSLFPVIMNLARRIGEKNNYTTPIRIGAAGSLGTPHALAAAFAMGADYVLTGSINQACVEAGTSPLSKEMLAKAQLADVAMGAASDMFEIGVKLQVLKRETLFAVRANKLYEIYTRYASIESIPDNEKQTLEKSIFRNSLDEIWKLTKTYFEERDPKQISEAQAKPKYKMALIFRWYLGLSSFWAIHGDDDRKIDYQIWCGPAMGAFNDWVRDTPLEDVSQRYAAVIAKSLMEGAATIQRMSLLRQLGIELPASLMYYPYQPLPE